MYNNKRFGLIDKLCGMLLAACGLAGSVHAGCIVDASDPSIFSILIDSTSRCDALSGNMYGCEVLTGESGCTIENTMTGEIITVELTAGSVGGTTPIDWDVTSSTTSNPNAGTVDFSVHLGATQGGTCGWSYSPGSLFGRGTAFEKSNGAIQKINGIFFCSDFSAPLPDVPRLLVTKTAMLADGTCGTDDSDPLNIDAGEDVKYCYVVENLGLGDATNVILIDDNATPSDASDDVHITLTGMIGGELPSGGRAYGISTAAVTIASPGEVINTATVDADSVDIPSYDVPAATDIATVIAREVLADCPADIQDAVNSLAHETPFAWALRPNAPEQVSVCVPDQDLNDTTLIRAVRTECIEECITSPACKSDPTSTDCVTPPECEPSGAWNYYDGTEGTCIVASDPEATPYCWEIAANLTNSSTCGLPKKSLYMKNFNASVTQLRSNPYVYQECTGSGGRRTCETVCYLYPGESCSACPPKSDCR